MSIAESPTNAQCSAAKMVPVAVSWGFRPRVELVAARPALLVDSVDELAQLATY